MAGGRLCINIISSDIPGEALDSAPRYQRTREWMQVLRQLLNGQAIDFHGEFVDLEIEPPRILEGATAPPFYFGGFSPAAKDVAAAESDVFLTWPDTVASVSSTVSEMTTLAAKHYGRELIYGLRAHVIVRETEALARRAAEHLVSKLDIDTGDAIRNKSLDAASFGVARQAALREVAADDGFVEDNLWTGVGRARSGAGAAIVGNPDQVAAKLQAYQKVGIGAFILSGYSHSAECDLFAEHVLPKIAHAPIKPRFAR
jgi:alkanesulfonate monooxygenase